MISKEDVDTLIESLMLTAPMQWAARMMNLAGRETEAERAQARGSRRGGDSVDAEGVALHAPGAREIRTASNADTAARSAVAKEAAAKINERWAPARRVTSSDAIASTPISQRQLT